MSDPWQEMLARIRKRPALRPQIIVELPEHGGEGGDTVQTPEAVSAPKPGGQD